MHARHKRPARKQNSILEISELDMKKAIIEITLVDESTGKGNEELENEIYKEISEGRTVIPWCKFVNEVTVSST